jgi:hypothetical protein
MARIFFGLLPMKKKPQPFVKIRGDLRKTVSEKTIVAHSQNNTLNKAGG